MLPKTIYGLATTSSPGLMSAEDKAKLDSNVVTTSLVGANNGIAQLDSSGKVPASQLPSYVDDVLEYNSASAFPATGEADKIYIAKDTNISYRWGGSAYVKIASDLALGETSSSAYRGDRGKTAYDHATDASRLTTAATSGLYKVAVTNEGHVASVTAVQKSDITNLGIPGSHQDISGKADKVSGATNGNFAGLDSNGNLIDSGKKATDFLPTSAIDDTAGEGDTGKTWSADKLVETFEETEEAAALSKVIDTPTQIVSFPDGARWPMKMEFGIEPVQELHGYANPWPAGGGKNLLPLTVEMIKSAVYAYNPSITWDGNTTSAHNGLKYTILTVDGNVTGISVSGTTTAADIQMQIVVGLSLPSGTYKATGGFSGTDALRISNRITGSDVLITHVGGGEATFTLSEAGLIRVSIRVQREVGTVINETYLPMIRLSTVSDATFEPYTNICPISGFDGANVTVTGKNLLPVPVDETKDGITLTRNADGSVKLTGTASTNVYFDFFAGNFDTTFFNGFRFVATGSAQVNGISFRISKANRAWIQTVDIINGASSLVVADNGKDLYFAIRIGTSTVIPEGGLTIYPMLVAPSETDFTFAAYQSTVYPITFPSAAGTVYGGTVTVNSDGTGELVVDRAVYEFDGSNDEDWKVLNSGQNTWYFDSADVFTNASQSLEQISSKYVKGEVYNGNTAKGFLVITSGSLRIRENTERSVESLKSDLSQNPLQVVVYLATEVHYSLTTGQILALLNLNNVWADTGNIQSLSYVRNTVPELIRQDTAGQIASALDSVESSLAIVIDGDVAPQSFSRGDHLFVRNHSTLSSGMYFVTSNIASGASITSNNVSKYPNGYVNSLKYANITNFNEFVPTGNFQRKIYGTSDGTATNAPISSANLTYLAEADGSTNYFTQRVWIRSASTSQNTNSVRMFTRAYFNGTFTNWKEIVERSINTTITKNGGTKTFKIASYAMCIVTIIGFRAASMGKCMIVQDTDTSFAIKWLGDAPSNISIAQTTTGNPGTYTITNNDPYNNVAVNVAPFSGNTTWDW